MKIETDPVDQVLTQWRRERPDLDGSGLAVVLRVALLAGTFSDRLKEVLAPSELAPFEFDVLSALRRAEGSDSLTPTELCTSAQLTSGAMSHRLNQLEARKLIRRRAKPNDRRSVTVALTAKGRRLVDEVLGARMEDAKRSLGALSSKEQRELARLLRTLTSSI